MAEPTYKWRGKDLTYDQFMDGPGAKMSTAQAEATMDKISGATKSRRSLQIAMAKAGYKKIEKNDGYIYFEKDGKKLHFGTYGELEKYLLENNLIKDEKAEAEKSAAKKEAKEKAKKEAAAKKAAEKKAADKAKAAAKKEAEKKKLAAKKAAEKARAIEKKKREAEKAKKKNPGKRSVGRPSKRTAKSASKTTKRIRLTTKLDDSLIIKIGKKNYTAKRLHDLALDAYKYDMGKDPKAAKKVQTYVLAEARKCLFIINGKDRGEFEL